MISDKTQPCRPTAMMQLIRDPSKISLSAWSAGVLADLSRFEWEGGRLAPFAESGQEKVSNPPLQIPGLAIIKRVIRRKAGRVIPHSIHLFPGLLSIHEQYQKPKRLEHWKTRGPRTARAGGNGSNQSEFTRKKHRQ